jgi:hypothetical protein
MAMTFNTYTRNDETRKYVKRIKNAGKTLDAFSVLDIDNFVTGCKDLGLWNNMVCWPLRSSQNTGTNTAFSLGGLGTFDGTLVNGPTWGSNGITSAGSVYPNPAPHINISSRNRSSYLERTVLIVVNPISFSFDDSFFGTSNYGLQYAGTGGGLHMFRRTNGFVGLQGGAYQNYQENYINKIQNGNFASFVGTISNGFVKTKTNFNTYGVSNNAVTPITDTNPLKLLSNGSAEPTRGLIGTMSFALDSNIGFSQAEADSIIALYKTTLGKGLGLP